MVFADDLEPSTSYGDFLGAYRQGHNFTYSYERECHVGTAVNTWIKDVKTSQEQVAEIWSMLSGNGGETIWF